ncbi:RNA polymerase sigma factor [Lutibacter sp.]|uniref:RNA polymerase sigma factor n=1 Tax=Lutibacter sp. TaxID=1925666 RepID=UPI002736364B|nr:sigma-70 family RNA polymerase sigma factor [Lutibacter sp.]MDP3314432.1 sigma-70 family RNA polymerase sigma factor [Lutibacter sp.]
MEAIESIKHLSDEILVERIVSNNNTMLYAVLYDRYSKVVYNKCLSFSKNNVEAEDLTQEIFINLFVKLSTFKGNSKFFTWLYAFTYNYCVNYVNRNNSKKIENKAVPIDDYDYLIVETDDESLFQIKVDILKNALDLISPEDKMILLLKYQDDISIKELSKILQIGESAVKMRLKRAKASVVKVYKEKF